jgi:predicted phosphodiesterase
MFADVKSNVIIYGHDHFRNICRGDKLYINVGSLGCPSKEHDVARAGVLIIEDGKVSYDALG